MGLRPSWVQIPLPAPEHSRRLEPNRTDYLDSIRIIVTVNSQERPVLLSLDGRGFYVLHYTAIPEDQLSRVRFDLTDPNTGEGGSAEAVVDPRLVEALNKHNQRAETGYALLIWIDTGKNEVSWQTRKFDKALSDLS